MKILKKIWPLIPGIILTIFFQTKWYFERSDFNNSKLNSKIVKVKNNWTLGRSYDYITSEGIFITLMNTDTLYINDSIVKERSSLKFKVFRNGKYISEFHLE